MRILHLLSQIQLTGAEAHAVCLADWFIQQGHEVTIISDKLHLPCKAQFIPRQIHTSRFFTRLKNILFIRQTIKEKNIEVIHTHSRAAVRVAYWAAWGLPVTLISTVHGRQHSSLSKKIFDTYGHRVIAVCENIRQHLILDFRMNPRKLITLGNPIDLRQLNYQDKLSEDNRIAIIGRTTGPKGEKTSFIIENVLPELCRIFPNLGVDLIGGSLQNLSIRAQSIFSQLQKTQPEKIRHFSHIENLEQVFNQYSIVIGAGRVAMSSILCGIPTYAIGEFDAEGIVQPENFQQCLASNFGDIGLIQKTQLLSAKQITEDLLNILNSGQSPEVRQSLRNLAMDAFAQEQICTKIHEIYKSATFQRCHPHHIPILMYHKITDSELETPHRIFVTKSNFEKHLAFFKSNGYTTMHFSELLSFKNGQKSMRDFPAKPLLLTFDDGYQNNLTHALPLLEKYQMKAVIYLLADTSLKTNSWDAGQAPQLPLMIKEERQQLANCPLYEIGSHGFRHQKITLMDSTAAFAELKLSKEALEMEFKRKVISYAFTYGETNKQAAELAEKAGYQYALNTDSGGLHLEENPYSVFRVNIFPEDSETQLKKKTSKWYRRYYYLRRNK